MKKYLLKSIVAFIFLLIAGKGYAQKPDISYANPTNRSYSYGTTIATYSPSNRGGASNNWTINKALPAGLSMSPTTGAITGTPTAIFTTTASYIITATNASGFDTFTIMITVSKAPLTITASDVNKVYGTTLTNGPSTTGWTSNGLVLGETIGSVTLNYATGAGVGTPATANVGTYTHNITPISATGGTFNPNNYTITYAAGNSRGDITITRAPLTVTGLIANDKVYNGNATETSFTGGVLVGLLPGDNVTLVPSGTFNNKNVATGINVTSNSTITGGDAGNYTLTQPTGLSADITPKALTITATGPAKTYGTALTAGATNANFSVTGTITGESASSVTLTPDAAGLSATTPANTTYHVAPSAPTGSGGFLAGNYTITLNTFTGTVSKATLTITANDVNKPYGTAITSPGAGSTAFTTSGLKNSETIGSVSIAYGTGIATTDDAGNYQNQVTPTVAIGGTFNINNYNVTYVKGDINVTKIPLTITATGSARTYGTPFNPAYNDNAATINFTYTGTVNGELVTRVFMISDINGFDSNAAAGSTYFIIPTDNFIFIPFPPQGTNGFSANNYDITFVSFRGTIAKAPVTVTANAVSKPFGSTLASPVTGSNAFTSTGLKNGQAIGSLTITYGAAKDAVASKGVYPLQVTPSAATGGTFNINNYNFTYTSNTLTVNSGIFDWTGANSADWATPQNWNIDGVQQTTLYPGSAIATNVVQIGVVAYTSGRKPTLAANIANTIASLTFGNATTPNTLTIGTTGIVSLTVSGNVAVNAGTANLTGFANSSLNIGGDYVTSTGSTFVNTSPVLMNISGNFNNGGTSTFGTALVTFNNPAATPATFTTTAPFTFNNVAFSNNGLKTLTTGDFSLATTGILTMAGATTTLDVSPASTLTLNSDANASASVAIIPTGCKITGQVKVQRYVSAKRAYRLISSPVNSGTTTPTSVYSLNYVKNSMYLTGTTGIPGGFDKLSSGPTLYLYKESFAGTNQAFTAGNFRDITDITTGIGTAPVYSVDLETNPLSLPAGGAFLAFYRGNRADASVDQETVTTFVPTAATMTATGVLNQGPVAFKDVFTGLPTLSFANALPSALGFNPIGNPYASTIDLETLGAGGIVAPGVSNFIYELNPVNQVYEIYPVGNSALATGNASRYIASGQGFFMMATATGQTVTINESAKVNGAATQNTAPKLFMSTPANLAATAAPQYFRLRMMKDSINTVDAVVGFKSTAKGKFDSFEDAPFRSGPASMSFASVTDDNRQATINQLPLAQKGQTIRFNVGGVVNTPYTLNVSAIGGIPAEYDVWLKDAYKKDSLDMRVNKSYSFTLVAADTGSYGAYRFTVVLRQNPARAYKLISFTGSKTPKKDVELDWTTQNEENYTHFTVERSTNNGRTYNVVGGLSSDGTGNYSLVDKNPSKNNLYRLKQMGINDSVSYSNVVKIDFSNRGDDIARCINVYPNPSRDRITLSIDAKAPLYKIQITNGWGFILQQTTSREPQWQTNVGRFLPGTYYIQVRNEKDWSLIGQTKFVKL